MRGDTRLSVQFREVRSTNCLCLIIHPYKWLKGVLCGCPLCLQPHPPLCLYSLYPLALHFYHEHPFAVFIKSILSPCLNFLSFRPLYLQSPSSSLFTASFVLSCSILHLLSFRPPQSLFTFVFSQVFFLQYSSSILVYSLSLSPAVVAVSSFPP